MAALVLALVTFPASLYLGVVAVASRLRKALPILPDPGSRVTVVIPAHNEEAVLGDTLDAVAALTSRGPGPDVVVIADNCTDATEAVARDRGARVLRRDDPDRPGKGPALDWALSHPDLHDGADFLFLLDADTIPESHALDAAVAWAHHTSADIVQLPFVSRGKDRGDRSAINVWTTTLMNRVRPRGLAGLGLPCRLQGGGMLIKADTARTHGWPAEGISEDLFATIAFLRDGVRIAYCDGAVVWARAAETDAAATAQRVRWESGRLRATRQLPRLTCEAITRRSPPLASLVAHLVVPPVTVHVVLVGTGLILAWTSGSGAAGVHALSAVLTGMYLGEGLRAMNDRALALTALGAGPRFAWWKLGVQWKALRSFRTLGWERTPRDDM